MALYEHVFLTRQDVTTQQVDDLVTQFSEIITTNGGEIKKVEYWGLKSLTFRIKKNRKAHFSLMNIDAPAAAVLEMERIMSINEDVIRCMTIRMEALEDGPSAMMQKKERDEKLERGAFDATPNFNDRGDKPQRSGGGRFRAVEGEDIETAEVN